MSCALRFQTFAPTKSTEISARFCQPALISAPRVLCARERAGDKDPCSGRARRGQSVSRTEVSPWCVADTGQDRGQMVYASLA